jgi:histidine ammonia-lyase
LLEFAHDYVRDFVAFAEEDRVFADDINKVKNIIADFSFVNKLNVFAAQKGVDLNESFPEMNLY